MAFLFGEILISEYLRGTTVCNGGSVEQISLENVARDENLQSLPLNFELEVHGYF
jgi:hypothetical protein